MGDLINLRRFKKVKKRTAEEQTAAANRTAHGTAKHFRKAAKAEKSRADLTVDAHKLNSEK